MDYQAQAKGFCKKYSVAVESKLLYHGPYWDDEKKSRDVYEITIKREGKKDWVFKFGQSIVDSELSTKNYPNDWDVCKARGLRKIPVLMTEMFKLRRGKKPTEYDVLACICKDDPEDFENFCSNFGYDTDSRKAEKTYFAVQKEYRECLRMFGDCLDELREIA